MTFTLTRPLKPAAFTVAVDPGLCYAGVALYQQDKLIHGAKVTVEKRRNICNQAEALANAILREVLSALPPEVPKGSDMASFDVLCEGQQHRKRETQKGDQNIVVQMAVVSGFILSKLKLHLGSDGAEAYWVPPTTWKGTIDKKIKLKQIRSTLTEEELAETAKNEHTMDAAGIGLWWLGRMR